MALLTLVFVADKSYASALGVLFALLHELGHLAAMKLSGQPPKQMSLGIFSIGILAPQQENLKDNIFIFLSGPAVNLVLGVVLFLCFRSSSSFALKTACLQNFILAFVNLLPISTLDGGKILKALITKKFGPILAEKIVAVISGILLVPLFVLGFLILMNSRYSLSIFIIVCYLISYIFCKESEFLT